MAREQRVTRRFRFEPEGPDGEPITRAYMAVDSKVEYRERSGPWNVDYTESTKQFPEWVRLMTHLSANDLVQIITQATEMLAYMESRPWF